MDNNAILAAAKQYMAEENDPTFVKEVEALIAEHNEKELFDRFYRTLEFGTGGLRGIIGGGTNRMNPKLLLPMIRAAIRMYLQKRPRLSLQQTALPCTSFQRSVRRRSYPMQFGSSAATLVLW